MKSGVRKTCTDAKFGALVASMIRIEQLTIAIQTIVAQAYLGLNGFNIDTSTWKY